jgi:ribonuclease-3
MTNTLKELQNKIKIKFKTVSNLKKAITHKSYDSINNYEKLEFLGDRLLGLIISKKLLETYPYDKVGALDKKLASLVNKNRCQEIGKTLNLDKYIFIGNKKNNNKIENKIISDCVEALIGAIYYEKDFNVTEKFILNAWKNLIKESKVTFVDAKTKLQEYSLKKFKTLPVYKLISITGLRHKPEFKIAVRLKDSKFIEGFGNSKKEAEQNAANLYLKNLNL